MARPFPKSPVWLAGEKDGHTVGDIVGCALKMSAAFITSVWIGLFPKTACISSSGFFLRCGGFLLVFILFCFWSHRTEVIVCTHHGTDIQINSTDCFFLHFSCELSPELSSTQVGHTCHTSVHLYFIQFFFNNGKINLTVVLNQKYPFSSLFLTGPSTSSPPKNF